MLFARALLALACAAPLLAARASLHATGPLGTQGDLVCTIAMRGIVSRFELTLPVEWKLVSSQVFEVNLDNLCGRSGRKLVGELVKVCDAHPPLVVMHPWPVYTPAAVTRQFWNGHPSQVSVHVNQYCDDH